MKNKLKILKKFTIKHFPKSKLFQYRKPYNSTIAFYNLLSKLKLFDHKIKNIYDVFWTSLFALVFSCSQKK